MRKTKCKSCNGVGTILNPGFDYPCTTCQGTGEISVSTIQELREGRVLADVQDLSYEEIRDFLFKIFPHDSSLMSTTLCKYYGRDVYCENIGLWMGVNE